MRRAFLVPLAILAALLLLAQPAVRLADRLLNATHAPASGADLASVRPFHDSLWVADLHSDALLWGRDLLVRSGRGHVDLPRLVAGGVDLQVFSATTRFPVVSNYARTPDILDVITVLALADGWPRPAWHDPFARALLQARRLEEAARRSGGGLRLVRTRADLLATAPPAIGAVLSLEGLHALDGRIDTVDSLFAAGYRVFGLAHMTDNAAAGSAHGWRRGGLTPLGERVLARVDSLGGIVDLAHASPATVRDVLRRARRPVLISHGGLAAVCPGPRNVPDDVLVAVAAGGGLVGVGFWEAAVCGRNADAIAASIRHAADVAGIEHVALGSDWDGAVRTPFDAAGLPALTAALRRAGFTDDEIRLVMGENVRRFLAANLPGSGRAISP